MGPTDRACFFLYSGESLLSSGFCPVGPGVAAVPGVAGFLLGEGVGGAPVGDFPFVALPLVVGSVSMRGRVGRAVFNASGGDREGKLMTESRKVGE
jgi:hypothetical protein